MDEKKSLRSKNWLVAGGVVLLILIFYGITVARISAGLGH